MNLRKLRALDAAVLLWIAAPFIRLRFHYTCDSLKKEKGPYLLLCNHVTDLDPFFLSMACGAPPRFVASEHILRKGLGGKLLSRYGSLIVHTKGGGVGMRSAMEMIKSLRGGDRVGLFPEGNRCFNGVTGDIPAVTGKLMKSAGVKVITFRLEGGYFTQPRWGFGFRRGRMCGRIVHIYSPEELAAMTNEEALAAVRRDLYEDAFAAQRANPVSYRTKAPAEGLEAAVFACPKCGGFGGLHTEGEKLFCDCGFSAVMDGFGFLHTGEEALTVFSLDMLQRELLAKRIQTGGSAPLFYDRVCIRAISKEHTADGEREAVLTLYPGYAELSGKRFTPEEISGAAIRSRNTLNIFTADGQQYEITGGREFCALKYLYWYRIHKNEVLF